MAMKMKEEIKAFSGWRGILRTTMPMEKVPTKTRVEPVDKTALLKVRSSEKPPSPMPKRRKENT